ncbi:hypothetical protein OSI00_26570, partial [Mycobacterium ulcerans]
LETSIERLRDHLRRPHARKRNHLTENAAYTVNQTDPVSSSRKRVFGATRLGYRPRAPALLISRLVSWVDDLWCRAIGAGV